MQALNLILRLVPLLLGAIFGLLRDTNLAAQGRLLLDHATDLRALLGYARQRGRHHGLIDFIVGLRIV